MVVFVVFIRGVCSCGYLFWKPLYISVGMATIVLWWSFIIMAAVCNGYAGLFGVAMWSGHAGLFRAVVMAMRQTKKISLVAPIWRQLAQYGIS